MNYEQRLEKVTDYIGEHIDDNISLDELSRVSCFSKFHFHRLFTAFTGLSLKQYIRWLRLKRAAHQLIVDKDQSILTIAMNAGFESHEAFSRAFKKTCGLSPSQFREGLSWSFWERSPYSLPKQGKHDMNVDIKEISRIRLAMIEHRGEPQLVGESVNKLISWAKAQPLELKPKAGETFAIAYDDPKTTPACEFRFDLGIIVSENLKLDGEITEKYLPAGRYAITMHKGSRNNIGETIYPLCRDWLPNAHEELGDFPCVFCYHNFDHEVAETELLTECRFLLK